MAFTRLFPVLLLASVSTARADPTVTIKSDNDEVTLNQITGEGTASVYGRGGSAYARSMSFRVVCRAPCDQIVPSSYKYFIDGEGMPQSRKFLLPTAGDVTLDVNTGNSALWGTGLSLILAGSIVAATGLITAPILGVGGIPGTMLAIGIPVAIVGIPVFLKGRTTVKLRRHGSVAIDLRRGALAF